MAATTKLTMRLFGGRNRLAGWLPHGRLRRIRNIQDIGELHCGGIGGGLGENSVSKDAFKVPRVYDGA